jgi:hypothetical protein
MSGKHSAYALVIATLVVSLALLAHGVHAAPTAHSVTDADQGAACTGTGDSQTGDCNTESGDQTSTETSAQAELPSVEG